jgi:hypothetical protein
VRGREIVLDRFACIDGHADVWAIFRDADALRAVVKALADPFRGERIAAVCGIESRGFLLGGVFGSRLRASSGPRLGAAAAGVRRQVAGLAAGSGRRTPLPTMPAVRGAWAAGLNCCVALFPAVCWVVPMVAGLR